MVPLMLQGFFVLAHRQFVKKNFADFLFGLNRVARAYAPQFKVIPANPTSVLLNNPDIQLLRQYNSKWADQVVRDLPGQNRAAQPAAAAQAAALPGAGPPQEQVQAVG